jgi:hypothetical protein
MVSKSKLKQKRKDKSKINIKQKQGTHIKIHIDNSKHTKRGLAKSNPRPQATIIHTNSPSQSQPFLIYNNPIQPPEITLGEISKIKNTIGEKPRDIVKETLYEQENKPISIGEIQKEKDIYDEMPLNKKRKEGEESDKLMEVVIEKNRRNEELQAQKQFLISEIRKYEYNEEYLKKISGNKEYLEEYLRDLKKPNKKKGEDRKILPEK